MEPPDQTRNDLVAVGTTAVEVSPARLRGRIEYFIRNSSTAGQVITLVFSNTVAAVALYGIPLYPGDFVCSSDSGGSKPYNGMMRAVANAAAGQLSIYERVK